MEAFLISAGAVALAEIGDKTQLLALILAARYRRPVPIILGILVATLVNHALAGLVGAWVAATLGPDTLRWILGLSFLAMAGWILVPDKVDAAPDRRLRLGVFGSTVVGFFLLEMGDKTQIATVALAARFPSLAAVVAGSTVGILLANVPAVLLGEVASRRLPLKLMHRIASVLFAVLGMMMLAGFGADERPPVPTVPPATCDRACLERQIDAVMAAMVAHDPSRLTFAPRFRYLENSQRLEAGEGRWRTVQGFGAYHHYLADPEAGTAAVITTMRENDEDGIFTLRIRVVAGRLAEAEAVFTHDPVGASHYARLGRPGPGWYETVPEDERMSREDLAEAANRYYGAMENNDGKGDYSFFADDCNRLEQGRQTTHSAPQPYGHWDDTAFGTLGCRGQFETGFLGFVTRIRDRRYEVIDVERGAVFSTAMIDSNDKYRSVPLTNGHDIRLPTYFSVPRTLQVGEAFRVRDGKLHDIETTLHELPYGMPIGLRSTFDPSREVPGGRAPDPARRCDGPCLEAAAEQLLKALVVHDPKRAPLSDTALYTENDQRIEFYDGLWGTLTEVGAYRLRAVEPARGEVSLIARVTETDVPGILALHLRLRGDRIEEIEATIVREERTAAEELFRPRLPVEAEPSTLTRPEPWLAEPVEPGRRSDVLQLAALVNRYFDAVERGRGGDIAFAADCVRRENGVVVTGNPELPRPVAAGRDATETGWTVSVGGPQPLTQPYRPYALGCAVQLASGYSAYIQRIRDRRLLTIDEARGLVVAAAYYDVPGTVRTFKTSAGATLTLPRVLGRPYSLDTLQVFRIENGAIRRIDSVARTMPYGARPYGAAH